MVPRFPQNSIDVILTLVRASVTCGFPQVTNASLDSDGLDASGKREQRINNELPKFIAPQPIGVPTGFKTVP